MIYEKSINLKSYKHGFFCRIGGVSKSYYNSLNCGYSSLDKKKYIKENRKRILNNFDSSLKNLIVPNQFHSNKIEIFKKEKMFYKCDGIINTHNEIVLGVLTADCCPILVGHKSKKLSGIIHAGWKGVYKGIIENFLNEVSKLDYKKEDLIFALGPCIGHDSYEVTSYFKKNFLKRYKQAEVFFKPKSPKNHFNFNLRGCIISILKSSNISDIWASKADTYKYPKKYFSYRYSVNEGNKDYGRMLSVILK